MPHLFKAEEWNTLSPLERAALCRLLAEQARLLAAQANPHHRDTYEAVARGWLTLAQDLEREANIPTQRIGNGGRSMGID